MKITKKKLKPFLDERGLELEEYTTSALHYYYLKIKGAVWQSNLCDKTHFYRLKDVFDFLIKTPSFNCSSINSNYTVFRKI